METSIIISILAIIISIANIVYVHKNFKDK